MFLVTSVGMGNVGQSCASLFHFFPMFACMALFRGPARLEAADESTGRQEYDVHAAKSGPGRGA